MTTYWNIFAGICLGTLALIIIGGLAFWLNNRREQAKNPVPRDCMHCEHYQAWDVDARVNGMACAKGHRLIAADEKTIQHTTDDGKVIAVTQYGWSGGDGFGEPMQDRLDCPHWKRKTGITPFSDMRY